MRIAFAVAAAALAFAAPAAALAPTRDTVHLTRLVPTACPGGVTLVGTFDLTREITTFYDADGTPVRQQWVVTWDATTRNPVTGVSVPTIGIRIFHRDLLTGEVFTTGSNSVTKLPDGGVSIPGAGRLVFDSTGHLIEHDGPDSAAEIAQLCEALA
jgi:hypothetical protein